MRLRLRQPELAATGEFPAHGYFREWLDVGDPVCQVINLGVTRHSVLTLVLRGGIMVQNGRGASRMKEFEALLDSSCENENYVLW
jgi:hypothetical protein